MHETSPFGEEEKHGQRPRIYRRDDSSQQDEHDTKYTAVWLKPSACVRSNTRPYDGGVVEVGATLNKRERTDEDSNGEPPPNYRIKKLCATAIAHTAPHARNPSGYPDGPFCVLAAQR